MGITTPVALLLGLALVGVPTLVHFLARPRPVRLPYSTVRFLREAIKQRRALFRFRDLLVLCLRVLAVLFLAAAFARLFSRSSSLIAVEGDEPTLRVVLLDASQSMQARRSVVQVFDRAKATAHEYVGYRSGLRADIVLAAARAQPLFDRLSENLTGLDAALSAVEAHEEALDADGALAVAAKLFNEAGGDRNLRRELIIISDLQRTNWEKASLGVVPAGVTWRFDQVGLTGDVGNLAVCDVSAVSPPRLGEPVDLAVDVGNFSAVEQPVTLKVLVGEATYEAQLDCPAWRRARAVVSLPADVVTPTQRGRVGGAVKPTGAAAREATAGVATPGQATNPAGRPAGASAAVPGAGWLCGTVRLEGARDVLPADDERPFALRVSAPQRYVLLSRDEPSAVATSRYFLERALCAGLDEEARLLDPAYPDLDLLTQADLIVAVDGGRLPPETVRLLASLLTRGSALLYVVQGIRDVENLLALEKACGDHLRLPAAFSPDSRPSGSVRRLAWVRATEQPFRLLAARMDLVGALEFRGGLHSVQASGGLPEEVLATFDDGSVALTVTACGRGRLAVLNMDLVQSTLPASPLFVPLVQELSERLTRHDVAQSTVAVGEPVHLFLPAAATAGETRIEGPGSASQPCGTLADTENGILWNWAHVEQPGVYRIFQHERLAHALAAACPESESDLRPLAPEELKTAAAGAQAVEVRQSSTEDEESEHRREWWPWLMLAALGCTLSELAVLKLFRT